MSDNKNLFEIAAIKKYRYPSSVGDLITEDLYHLPLVADGRTSHQLRPNLNDVARAINSRLKALGEESFVETRPAGTEDLQNKLDIVRTVIAYKQAQEKAATDRAQKRQQREALKQAIAEAEAREMGTKSVDELKKMLADLGE